MNIKRMPSDYIIKELDEHCNPVKINGFLIKTREVINDLKRYELTPEEIRSRSFNPLESIILSMPKSCVDYGIFIIYYEDDFIELSALIPRQNGQQEDQTRGMIISLSKDELELILKDRDQYTLVEHGDKIYKVITCAYNNECEIFDMDDNDKAICYGIEDIEKTLTEIENESSR